MKTDIPTARKLLQEARSEAQSREAVNELIDRALSMMTRGRTKRITARIEGRAITPELEEQIWATYSRDPELSVLAIARRYDVNPGRVSEIIARRSA